MSRPIEEEPMQEHQTEQESIVRAFHRLPDGLRHPIVVGVAAVIVAGLLFLAGMQVGRLTYELGWIVPITLAGILAVGATLISVGVKLDRRRIQGEAVEG
jgi:hypothetical protein